MCEALLATKIHPLQACNTIKLETLKILLKNIKRILSQAIVAGGSSLKDHAQVNGEAGYFQNQFTVYGKDGKLCTICRKDYIKRITQAGRSTFYCPTCQKKDKII